MNLQEILKIYFGYDEFRRGQDKLIEGIVKGRDALGIMPTGGGKSLCYQLPAIALDGITIVISPLISLMKDQVDSLNEIGINAAYINSTLGNHELLDILDNTRENKYRIIYVAPERLNTGVFVELVKDIKVSLVAIDEAHCISQWGHDFRPSYLEIPRFINSLESRPMVAAFTATATKEIIKEIKILIGLKNPIEVTTGFDRPNLYYQVIKVSKKSKFLMQYLDENFKNESGIIYCATRKTVESLVKLLNDKGFSAVGYHGGMNPEERQNNQDDFILGRERIIVATNAFGMGIDKPDVRFVIHYNMPKNMEAYYQEAGRAGRDGEKSDCILLYSSADIVKQKLMLQNDYLDSERQEVLYKNLQYLVNYCNTNDCLRNQILKYFDEEPTNDNCKNCSNCLDNSEMIDITLEAQKILSCIYRTNQRYGTNMIIQVLRRSKNKKVLEAGLDQVSTYGIMEDYSNNTIGEIIMTLASKGCIHITHDKYPVLKLTNKSMDVLSGKIQVFHKKHLLQKKEEENGKYDKAIKGKAVDFDKELFEQLKEHRHKIAHEKQVPPYVIFHDAALKEMAAYFPQDKEAFLKIKGVGDKKYENYGKDFINLIKIYCNEKGLSSIKQIKEEQAVKAKRDLNKENKLDRYELTYNCYLERLSLNEIAEKRELTVSTILNHLEKCEKDGREIEWERFIDDKKEKVILKVINDIGAEKLKPIKEALPNDFSYDDIKIVICRYGLGVC